MSAQQATAHRQRTGHRPAPNTVALVRLRRSGRASPAPSPALACGIDPEGVRGAKEWTSERAAGRAYSPTVDQAALPEGIDIDLARCRSDSFDKFCRVLEGWLT